MSQQLETALEFYKLLLTTFQEHDGVLDFNTYFNLFEIDPLYGSRTTSFRVSQLLRDTDYGIILNHSTEEAYLIKGEF